MPDDTPVLHLPYPLGDDAIRDYPAIAQELAEDVEAALVALPAPGLVRLWDSVVAGVALPAASITTPVLPNTYRNLRVSVRARTSQAVTSDNLCMRVNGDTGSNYFYNGYSVWNGSPGTINGQAGATFYNAGPLAGDGLGNDTYTLMELLAFDYANVADGRYKTFLSRGAFVGTASGSSSWSDAVGEWRTINTRIQTLTFLPAGGGNLKAGTRITIYGEA